MKTINNLALSALIAGSLLVPSQSRAGEENKGKNHENEVNHNESDGDHNENDGDHNESDGNQGWDNDKKDCNPAPGNSVPINGGLAVLFAAGLGLGAKIILDKNKKKETESGTI